MKTVSAQDRLTGTPVHPYTSYTDRRVRVECSKRPDTHPRDAERDKQRQRARHGDKATRDTRQEAKEEAREEAPDEAKEEATDERQAKTISQRPQEQEATHKR